MKTPSREPYMTNPKLGNARNRTEYTNDDDRYVINWRELDNVTNTVQPEVSGINTGSYCIFKINV